jgi:hypothetical protein
MARTPAAELARVKIAWPAYRIERQPRQFVAWHRATGRTVRATTLAGLEHALNERNERHPIRGTCRPPGPGT